MEKAFPDINVRAELFDLYNKLEVAHLADRISSNSITRFSQTIARRVNKSDIDWFLEKEFVVPVEFRNNAPLFEFRTQLAILWMHNRSKMRSATKAIVEELYSMIDWVEEKIQKEREEVIRRNAKEGGSK